MTFSLIARCADTGMFGLAISSSSPAVAARCAYARAGVGAVASQNVTDPTLGPLALDLMQNGMGAAEAIERVGLAVVFRVAGLLAKHIDLGLQTSGGSQQ